MSLVRAELRVASPGFFSFSLRCQRQAVRSAQVVLSEHIDPAALKFPDSCLISGPHKNGSNQPGEDYPLPPPTV